MKSVFSVIRRQQLPRNLANAPGANERKSVLGVREGKKSLFRIVQFRNPSGSVAYRVRGIKDGNQVRKNISTTGEAEAYRQQLDIDVLNQSGAGLQTPPPCNHAKEFLETRYTCR